MRVMVTGSGGREHALGYAIAETTQEPVQLFFAPGNGGTEELGENVPIPVGDIAGQARFARQNKVDFTVIGPDDQLAAGAVDYFEEQGLATFGPTQAAAQVESSKTFAKELTGERAVPTANSQSFDNYPAAMRFLGRAAFPKYVKADGLALGKGAVKVQNQEEAERVVTEMMVGGKFGPAGERIVIEDDLGGPEIPEVSLHALTDGTTYRMLPAAQDHKTIRENGEGPMTGGMGTVSPVPGLTPELVERYGELIVGPMLAALQSRGTPFRGLLYPGLKLPGGQPRVLEYNARFGDPETQVYARLALGGFLDALVACREGNLASVDLRWRSGAAACITLASAGYPESSQKGVLIKGIDDANGLPGVRVFHAGTARRGNQVVTNGGRVLSVTATGDNLTQACDRAYEAINYIDFPGMQYRIDIGQQAIFGITAS